MNEKDEEDQWTESRIWRAKYERLYEAHRKLQKTNNGLEDKLLRVVEKFQEDKNLLCRDLSSQTQKLVEAKLTVQHLREANSDLSSDLHLSIHLLRNRPPETLLSQRVQSLSPDMQTRLRSYLSAQKLKESGTKIRVSADSDSGVSAAILARVLEERDKERRQTFSIDVGTQTLGWHFKEISNHYESRRETMEKDQKRHLIHVIKSLSPHEHKVTSEICLSNKYLSKTASSASSISSSSSSSIHDNDEVSKTKPLFLHSTFSSVQTDL